MTTRRNRGRVAASAIIASLGLAALAACGGNSSSPTATGSQGGSGDQAGASAAGIATAKAAVAKIQAPLTTWPSSPAVTNPVSLKGKTIMLLPLGESIPVINGQTAAAQAALQHMGATVTICDGKFDPSAVSSCLQQAASQHVYALMSLFVDYQMAPNAFNSTVAAGVKVLVGGEPADGDAKPGPNFAFYNTNDTVALGQQYLADDALADLGTTANLLYLHLSDSAMTTSSGQAGIDEFTKLCPTCGIATINFTTANLDKVPSAVSAALVSHPKTNVVIVPVDTFVPAAIQGIQSAGFAGKVEVLGASSDLAGLQRVKAGQQAHDLGASVVFEGYRAANALMQLLSGDKVVDESTIATRDFNKTTVGGLSLTTAAYDSPEWFGNNSFEAAFYKSWGGN